MAIPLIAMAIAGGIRMATPAVAKYLAKQGFKKASKAAVKKTPNAPKMNMSQAKKAVSQANKPSYKGPVIGSATKPKYKGPVIGSATKPKGLNMPGSAKPATKPKGLNMPSRAKPGSSKIPSSKKSATKGSAFGSPGQKAIGGGAAFTAAAIAAAGNKKPKPKSESKSTIADVKKKPKLSKPKPKPKAKAVSQAKAAPMMFDAALQSKKQEPKSKAKKKESMSIFDFAAGKGATPRFKQRKSKPGEVTLFGFDVDVDSTDKGMAMEEFDSKYGGQIKSTVKRRMGGKVRGYGKAMRGY